MGDAAFAVLFAEVAQTAAGADDLLAATGAWSLVHGFATLWLDGNLAPEVTGAPPEEAAVSVMTAWAETLFADKNMPA